MWTHEVSFLITVCILCRVGRGRRSILQIHMITFPVVPIPYPQCLRVGTCTLTMSKFVVKTGYIIERMLKEWKPLKDSAPGPARTILPPAVNISSTANLLNSSSEIYT
uniref:Uncharacterized protein n=1 Tax=Ditylenchus dipsaci TaxID=166011 RepID=A0A915DU09_9BILA